MCAYNVRGAVRSAYTHTRPCNKAQVHLREYARAWGSISAGRHIDVCPRRLLVALRIFAFRPWVVVIVLRLLAAVLPPVQKQHDPARKQNRENIYAE